MDTSLIINATNGNKKVTKAITNINPEKDNTILKTFAQKVNALTTNSYVDATRVDKMSVNESGGGTSKTEPTLTITAGGEGGSYTYNGDGDIFAYTGSPFAVSIDRTAKTFTIKNVTSVGAGTDYTVTLYAAETDNFAAKSVSASYEYGG